MHSCDNPGDPWSGNDAHVRIMCMIGCDENAPRESMCLTCPYALEHELATQMVDEDD